MITRPLQILDRSLDFDIFGDVFDLAVFPQAFKKGDLSESSDSFNAESDTSSISGAKVEFENAEDFPSRSSNLWLISFIKLRHLLIKSSILIDWILDESIFDVG